MGIYLTVIIISSILFKLVDILYSKKSTRAIGIVVLSFTVLAISVFSGLRNEDVGTDMNTYVVPFHDYISSSRTLAEAINMVNISEYGYILLDFISSRINNNIHFFLIICEIIKLTLVCIGALKLRNKMSFALFMTSYMLFFWWYGLSLMRQSLAISICIYAVVSYLLNKKKVFYFSVIIAWMFHNSSFLMLILPFVDFLITHKVSLTLNVILMLLLFSFSSFVLVFISRTGLVNNVMAERYMDSGVDIAKTNLLITIVELMFLIFRRKKIQRNIFYCSFYCAAYCLFFLLLSRFFEVAFRVSYYPFIVMLIMAPIVIERKTFPMRLHKRKFKRFEISVKSIERLAYILLFFVHFLVSATHGLGGTIPYSSSILGI